MLSEQHRVDLFVNGSGWGLPPFRSRVAVNIRQALGLSFGTSLAIQAIGVGTGVLLARTLEPAGRGELAALLLWPLLLASLAMMGLPESATFLTSKWGVSEVVGSAALLAVILGVSAAVVGLGVVPVALHSHGESVVVAGLMALILCPLHVLSTTLVFLVNGFDHVAYQALRITLIAATAFVLCALAGVGLMTPTNALLAYVVGYIVTLCATSAFILRHCDRLSVHRRTARTMLRYGTRTHGANVLALVNERAPFIFVILTLSTGEIGLFTTAIALAALAPLIGTSVSRVALPDLAQLEHTSVPDRRIGKYLGLTVVSAVVPVCLLWLLAPELIRALFGADYSGATSACRVLLIASVPLAVKIVFTAIFNGLGAPGTVVRAEFTSVCVGLPLMYFLTASYGIEGAAAGVLVSVSIPVIVLFFFWHRHRGLPIHARRTVVLDS